MLFDGWESIGRIVLLGACTYVVVIAALRLVGKEALAKMSAFDLVITIALGSIVATIPFSPGVSLADGVALIATYLALQALTRVAIARSRAAQSLVKAQPEIVLWNGELVQDRLVRLRLTREEVRAAVRGAGHGSLGDIQAVVLENDGQWSIIPRSEAGDVSALEGLDIPAGPHHG